MLEKLKKIVRLIFDMLVVLFVVFFVYVFLAAYSGRVPNILGYHFFRVVSSSMEPEIVDGDCIISKTTDINEIKEGDIITFYSEDPAIYNFLNTHRVVSVIQNDDGTKEFVTKGDSNPYEDVYTAKDYKIIGVYQKDVFIGRIISKCFEILSNSVVYFLLIMLPVLLCFISSVVDIINIVFENEIKEDMEENIEKDEKEIIDVEKDTKDEKEIR